LGQGRPQPLSDGAALTVERVVPRHVIGGTNGAEVAAGADQQSGAPTGGRVWRVRRVPAARQPDPGAEVVGDVPGEQADEIGVPRQPGVHAIERMCRDCGAADVVEPFEHRNPQARLREIPSRDQAVVTSANDDGVVGVLAGHGLAQFR
jgi:hypothetical protein